MTKSDEGYGYFSGVAVFILIVLQLNSVWI